MTTSEHVYGHVQDDGTVRAYQSEEDAEAAGPLESLVVYTPDNGGEWIYPTNGRAFKPEDVLGLSPARATREARAALDGAGLGKHLSSNGVTSDNRNGTTVITHVHMLKKAVPNGWRDQAIETLGELPDVVRVNVERDDPMYNYWFLSVIRKKVS